MQTDDSTLVAGASASVPREIIDVLVDNALRHGHGAVTVRARKTRSSIAVDVGDEGRGAALHPEHVFERRSESAEGHGIGLALARSLAHAEGAQLLLSQSTPPVFTLLLPRPTEAEEGAAAAQQPAV